MNWFHLVTPLLLWMSAQLVTSQNSAIPTLKDSLTAPILSTRGKSVLLTCVVRNLGNYSLLWKYGSDKILTADSVRITTDDRIQVIHDEGGDVFVLQIRNVTHNDTGFYTCEVNTDPPIQSFHKLTVLSDQLVAPSRPSNGSASIALWGFSTPSPINHDYTGCCRDAKVSRDCLGYCNIKNILEGTTGIHPAKCDPFFKDIVRCMADGRDHVPCCERNGVPDVCQDMCVGEYTVQTDDVRTHISCGAYTAPTLACISEGIDTLPSKPKNLEAENITDSMLTLTWNMDEPKSINPLSNFVINVTKVRKLIHPDEGREALRQTTAGDEGEIQVLKVNGTLRSKVVTNLDPFTLYNITMVSQNDFGQSLPTYVLKVLTKSKKEAKEALSSSKNEEGKTDISVPELPDIKQCCRNNNVTHASCVENFCDPLAIQTISVPDVIVCAPWGNQMFGCMSDKKDHSECCRRRDIPDVCIDICSGNPPSLDYRHFKCVEHMPSIANCMLSSYGVLPSSPRNFRFSNVGTNLGLLHWDTPNTLADTVTGYKVTYTLIQPGVRGHNVMEVKRVTLSPYIMENLETDASYEVFVQAENHYGVGDPSSRIVFRTAKSSVNKSPFQDAYDPSKCCRSSGVRDECLPMCRYNASLIEITSLTRACESEMAMVTKCAAGGRDHLPCCGRRGVSTECQMLCQGVQLTYNSSIFTRCLSYVGNIMMCLEEGVANLPEPVSNFHVQFVNDTKVTFAWDPVDNIDQYEVYYKQLRNNSSTASAFEHEMSINVTQPQVVIAGLETNVRYQFFAITRNKAGTSLPSSMVTLNVSRSSWNGQIVKGKPSAPHNIEITKTGANFLAFVWTAPAISELEDRLKYRLTYGSAKDFANNETGESQLVTVETWSTNLKLNGLKPNSQYIIYLSTLSTKNNMTSEPSETILAWTSPLVDAYVEPPIIYPSSGVFEGGSMTVLCIAFGTPTPNVTLFLGNHLIRSERSRHMVTVIHNVTKDMEIINCLAMNGESDPMASEKSIRIGRSPTLKGPVPPVITSPIGQDVTIECTGDAWPTPAMTIGRIGVNSSLVSDRFDMNVITVDNKGSFKIQLTIRNAQSEDSGSYYCMANNTYGSAVNRDIALSVLPIDQAIQSKSIESCCEAKNVSSRCMGICSLQIDLDFLLYQSECYPEFDKLMSCASDGSDHRHCCSVNGVPRDCLNWCRGLPTTGPSEVCALSHARTIAQCFHEGRFTLPGPPKNIRVTPTSSNTAVAKWDPPEKNAEAVQLYRILWKPLGSGRAQRADTSKTRITIENLQPGVIYELVMKAGNANGTSQLTPPLKFITADKYIVETTNVYSDAPSIVGALVAVVLLLLLVGIAVWYVKGSRKPRPGSTSSSATVSPNTSFENPYFNQEITMSQLQATEVATTSSEVLPDNMAIVAEESDSESKTNAKRLRLPKLGGQSSAFGFQRFQ